MAQYIALGVRPTESISLFCSISIFKNKHKHGPKEEIFSPPSHRSIIISKKTFHDALLPLSHSTDLIPSRSAPLVSISIPRQTARPAIQPPCCSPVSSLFSLRTNHSLRQHQTPSSVSHCSGHHNHHSSNFLHFW